MTGGWKVKQPELFDVTIIGGGPAGLYASFYSGLREMKTKIIEFQPHLGGKVHIYPEKMIWDVGALTPVTGARLIEQMVQQGLTFHPTVILNEKVEQISKEEAGHFVLETTSGERHLSKTVIVATGSGIFKPQKLQVKGAEKFEVTNLHYTVTSMQRFKDKTVILSGGGNTAIDWANELESVAKKIYLAYRKEELKGHESQVTQLMNSSIECLFHTEITNLIANPNQDRIESVELTDRKKGTVHHLPVDEVIINHGYEQDISLLNNSALPIQMVNNFYIKGSVNSASSIPGLYAAGDILHHEGKLHLIAGAFQDAANAVNQAKLYLQPDAPQTAMVSSHHEIFQSRNRELKQRVLIKR